MNSSSDGDRLQHARHGSATDFQPPTDAIILGG
ncbi:hypothetical protein M6B38_387075 [Iris pallida]|uniref:Uncharacterized protein n=1 Tax=Iris pallida TaxID=29817 RepID=A0AAX6G1Y6_IRIPA|nr:hypothetical protein M6B38_387075 [Iris pallida]